MPLRAFIDSYPHPKSTFPSSGWCVLMPLRAFIDSYSVRKDGVYAYSESVLMPLRAFIDSYAVSFVSHGWPGLRLNALAGIH